ncbi:MAG: co-chaperone GroES [Patescibacteria group bacterium]|nr:co-chaperone GroES [Patescibacteria group bacterium]
MELNQIKPLEDNILVEPLEKETTTASGIVIPDTAKEKPQQGKVLAVGAGKRDDEGKVIPLDVKVGQTILYKKWGGSEIKVEGKEYLIVKSDDILAVIE